MLLRPIKDLVLMKYETYLSLERNGFRDISILLNAYEWAGIGLEVEKNIPFNEVLAEKMHNLFNMFWKVCIGFDYKKQRFVSVGYNEKQFKLFKYNFDSYIMSKCMSDIDEMRRTISYFLFQNYDMSDEDIIRHMSLDIEFDKGVFGVDSSRFYNR